MECQKSKNQRKNKRYSLLIILGIFFFFIGSLVLVYNHYEQEKQLNLDNQLVEEFFEIEQEEVVEENTEEGVQETEKKEEIVIDYIAVLEIPKISLKRGLVDKTSPYNNVDRNIYMLKETTLPDDEDISHIYLASHSGNSSVSFFRNLKKLNINDKVNLYYKNTKYIYEVSKKYEIEKTGTMAISKTDISDIILITCVSGTNKQIVFVAKLIDQQNY